MPEDPTIAAARALAVLVTGKSPDQKGSGLKPRDSYDPSGYMIQGIDPKTGRTIPAKAKPGQEAITRYAAGERKPAKPVKNFRVPVVGAAADRSAPPRDQLRDRMLVGVMSKLDQTYGNDPSYKSNRDAIKYTVQQRMDVKGANHGASEADSVAAGYVNKDRQELASSNPNYAASDPQAQDQMRQNGGLPNENSQAKVAKKAKPKSAFQKAIQAANLDVMTQAPGALIGDIPGSILGASMALHGEPGIGADVNRALTKSPGVQGLTYFIPGLGAIKGGSDVIGMAVRAAQTGDTSELKGMVDPEAIISSFNPAEKDLPYGERLLRVANLLLGAHQLAHGAKKLLKGQTAIDLTDPTAIKIMAEETTPAAPRQPDVVPANPAESTQPVKGQTLLQEAIEETKKADLENGIVPEIEELPPTPKDASKPILAPAKEPLQPSAQTQAKGGIETMRVEDIGVHHGLQYKMSEVTDRANNVSGKLKDVDVYDRAKGGTWTVWEDKNGTRYALNSHHRRELANRAGSFVDSSMRPGEFVNVPREVPVNVLREADGWTMERARAYGAMENIGDGKGTAFDAVGVMRDTNLTKENWRAEFAKWGISLKQGLVKKIDGLMELPPEALDYIKNNSLSEDFLSGVGRVEGLSKAEQMLVIESAYAKARAGEPPTTMAQGEQMATRARGKLMHRAPAEDDGFGLFGGDDEFTATLANLDKEADIIALVKKKMAGARSDLLKIPDELLEGEELKTDARKARAAELGATGRNTKDRVDWVLEKDRALSSQLDELAKKVVNGEITEAEAAAALYGPTVERVSGDLRQYVDGSKNAGKSGGVQESRQGEPGPTNARQEARPDLTEVSSADIAQMRDDYRGRGEQAIVDAFGEEGAKEWKRALQMENSSDRARSAEGERIRDAMEAKLSESQRRKVFGMDEAFYEDELADFANKAFEIDEAQNAGQLGSAISKAVQAVKGGSGDVDAFTAFQIIRAEKRALALGIDPTTVIDAAIARRVFFDGADATELLGMPADDVAASVERFRLTRNENSPDVGGLGGGQRGATDVKTLAKVAGVGIGAYAVLGDTPVRKWLEDQGIDPKIVAGLGLGAILAKPLLKGAARRLKAGPETGRLLIDPRELAMRAGESTSRGARMAGAAVDMAVRTRDRTFLLQGIAMHNLKSVSEEIFGKNFFNDKEFRAMDRSVRDKMELNIEENRPWSDGMTDKEKTYVANVRSSVMDPLLDLFEDEGGRILVRNDGTQQTKLQPGALVKLPDGRWGVYEGHKLHGAGGGPDDPFAPEGGFGLSRPEKVDVRTRPDALNVPSDQSVDLIFQVTGKLREDGSLGLAGGEVQRVIVGPGERFGRPVNRIGDSFVPRILSPDFLAQLRTIKSKGFNDALTKMLEEQNAHLGLSGDKMLGRVIDLAESMENTGRDVASFMSNLEKERQFGLAKFEYVDAHGNTIVVDPYESSYFASAAAYAQKAALRVAVAEQFGTDAQAVGNVLRSVKDVDAKYGSYLEKVIGRSLGLGPEAPKYDWEHGIARAEGSLQSLTKLTSPTTHVAQLGDLVLGFSESGFKAMGKAVWKLVTDNDARETATILSGTGGYLGEAAGQVLGERPTTAIQEITGGAKNIASSGRRIEGVQNFTSGVMTAIGLKAMDRAVKAITIQTAIEDAGAALQKAVELRKGGKAVTGSLARKLERYGLSDQIGRASAQGIDAVFSDAKVQATFGGKTRNMLMYTGAAADNPVWMSSDGGAILSRFRKPLYVTTRYVIKNVVGEALEGNYTPMARFVAAGVAGGAVISTLKSIFRFDGTDDEFRKLLLDEHNLAGAMQHAWGKVTEKTLFNGENWKSIQKVLFHAGKGFYDSGSLGVGGELMPGWNTRLKTLDGGIELTRGLAPPSVSSAANLVSRAVKIFNGSDIPEERALQIRKEIQEGIETEIVPLRRVTSALGLESPLSKMGALERKVKAVEQNAGPKLTPSEMRDYGKMKPLLKGKFNEIRKDRKKLKGRSYPQDLNQTLGLNGDGTIRRP